MTFGRVAEALPQAIGCVSWQKLVKSFFFYRVGSGHQSLDRLLLQQQPRPFASDDIVLLNDGKHAVQSMTQWVRQALISR